MVIGGRTHGFFSVLVIDMTATSALNVNSDSPGNLGICVRPDIACKYARDLLA
jgi:hypothetical protein